jgi:hypothetical protein
MRRKCRSYPVRFATLRRRTIPTQSSGFYKLEYLSMTLMVRQARHFSPLSLRAQQPRHAFS